MRSILVASALILCAAAAGAQVSYTPLPLDSGFGQLDLTQPPVPPQQIIQKFTAKETEFQTALANYTFERSVRVDTIDDDTRKVDGEYYQVTDISADPDGKKYEHVVEAPQTTLERVMMSPADFQDIEHRLPFVLTEQDAGQYDVSYVGKQPVDEVPTYVFDVKPKVIEKNKRYFQGRIWVDAKDYQIVVTNGKNVPDDNRKGHEDLSPPFMTFRQQIDGKYWFPVYTKGDGVLHFQASGGFPSNDVHMKEIVKYSNYKRFGSSVRITFDGQNVEKETPDAAQKPAPPAKPQ